MCVCEDRRRHEGLLVSLSGLRVSGDHLLRHSSVARGTAQVPRRDVPESVSVTDYKYPPVGERLLISAYLAGLRVRSRLLNKAPFLRRGSGAPAPIPQTKPAASTLRVTIRWEFENSRILIGIADSFEDSC